MASKTVRTILTILTALSIFLLCNLNALAAPARKDTITIKQPTGEEFRANVYGDEWYSWVLGESGEVIVRGEDGFWYYGQIINNKLVAGTSRYIIDQRPQKTVSQDNILILARQNSKIGKTPSFEFQNIKFSKGNIQELNSITSQKLLVLLIEFNDSTIVNSDSTWNNILFGTSGSTVNRYYNEVSNGIFNFEPAQEEYGTSNDGVVKIKLNYNHPNTGRETDERNRKLVMDALKTADPYIDFSKYDQNADGYISTDELCVVTVIAGFEASYNIGKIPNVWGHQWSLFGEMKTPIDGKFVCTYPYGAYAQMGEIHDNHVSTIGILCHELGHVLGLPDLYDYDQSSRGVGTHSLMSYGSWGYVGNNYSGSSPVHMDAWSKTFLGFSEPVIVNSSIDFTSNSFSTGSYNIFKLPTDNPLEYFLIENRQFNGFDAGLKSSVPSGGIAIWHIDENIMNIKNWYGVNNDESHKGVDIEEANEGIIGHSQLDKNEQPQNKNYNHYYYMGNNQIFNINSIPNSDLYNGKHSNFNVEVNSYSSDSMNVKVTLPDSVTGVKLNNDLVTLCVNDTVQLAASVIPENAANKNVIWSSDKPDIASVDQTGLVKANKVGTSTITVKTEDGGFTATCKVNVIIPKPVKSINLKTASLKLGLNQTQKLEYTITPGDATNKNVTWSSSDTKAATVDNEGNVKGVGKGTAKITVATIDGNKTATCTVSVIPVEKVTISKTSIDVKPGYKVSLRASVYPANAVNKNIVWESSDEKIAIVDAKGNVTGINNGTAKIFARSQENKDIVGECKISVGTPVSSIKLNTTSATLTTLSNLNTLELVPTILPESATNRNVIWSSSNIKIATVNDFGVVKAIGIGTVKITAASESGNKTATCTIRVLDPAKIVFVESIKLTNIKTGKLEGVLAVGKTGTISAKVTGKDGKTPTYKQLNWKSSNINIVSVDSNGRVSAKAPGKVNITATAADGTGVNASVEIEVIQPITSLSQIQSKTIAVNEEIELTVLVLPKDITQDGISIVWSKSDRNGYLEFKETDVLKKDTKGNLVSAVLEKDNDGNPVSKIRLKGLKKGIVTLTLTITTKDGTYKKVTCKVTVK